MIFGISKTTVNGVLALLITVGLALLASGSPLIGTTATAVITLVLAVLRAVVGFLQTDAAPTVNTSSKIPPAAMLAFLAVFLALPSLTACKGPTAIPSLHRGLGTHNCPIDRPDATVELSASTRLRRIAISPSICATTCASTASVRS